ncbi:hypothetical protein [Cryptosporangium minutisporangium]|uniref:NurA domain-containing protein n=1 Tax=Cryptosporangium minutisporangium TaxID=113569 RepID=A0ABP6TEB6_9ACTN
MRFSVDAWDPGYGTSTEDDAARTRSTARVELDVERDPGDWKPIEPSPVRAPSAVLFVDGVRRIDAQLWVHNGPTASLAICASYAAGVVCCTDSGATVPTVQVRRGVFTAAEEATPVATAAGTYALHKVRRDDADALSLGVQNQLADVEVEAARRARDGLSPAATGADLLVVDGPLRGRQHLPRAIGFIKTHRAEYLPAHLNGVVARLEAAHRSPVFRMGTSWDRYAWYIRLPGSAGAPWAGVVRVECAADLTAADAVALANLSQETLCRYASVEFKDSRAPQNLYPIAGLERALRRRLGDPGLLYRALRAAARS